MSVMGSLETLSRLETVSRHFFTVLFLVSRATVLVLVSRATVLVLVSRGTVLVLALVSRVYCLGLGLEGYCLGHITGLNGTRQAVFGCYHENCVFYHFEQVGE